MTRAEILKELKHLEQIILTNGPNHHNHHNCQKRRQYLNSQLHHGTQITHSRQHMSSRAKRNQARN